MDYCIKQQWGILSVCGIQIKLTDSYFDFVEIKCFRDALIKLRMGVLPLNANRFRYAHENTLKILCSFCENEIEDENHFICFCPLYKEFRLKYIQSYLQNDHSFTLLMQYHEKIPCQNLTAFAFHACKKNAISASNWKTLLTHFDYTFFDSLD